MAREDLNPVDEARACAALVEDLGLSKEELARRLGRSRPSISNLIRLLDLPDEVLDLLASGELSEGHGRAILQAQGNEARRALAREAAARGWSVRETERRAKKADAPQAAPRSSPTPTRRPPWSAPRRRSSRRWAPASASVPLAAASARSSTSTTWTSSWPSPGSAAPAADRRLASDVASEADVGRP